MLEFSQVSIPPSDGPDSGIEWPRLPLPGPAARAGHFWAVTTFQHPVAAFAKFRHLVAAFARVRKSLSELSFSCEGNEEFHQRLICATNLSSRPLWLGVAPLLRLQRAGCGGTGSVQLRARRLRLGDWGRRLQPLVCGHSPLDKDEGGLTFKCFNHGTTSQVARAAHRPPDSSNARASTGSGAELCSPGGRLPR